MDQVGSGADFLLLDATRAPARGLTDWLVDALRTAIDDGRLGPGARLPASRALAADLAVSRGVVVEAYRRLTDEGLVGGRRGGGTTVLHQPVRLPPSSRHPAVPTAGPPRLPRPRLPMGEGVDLSPGVPDLSAFPRNLWLRTERAVLTETPPDELGYGDPRGHPLHVLVTLPDSDVDDAVVADELSDAGVLVHPLSWHRRRPGPPGLVIGYAAHPPDRLRAAAVAIGRAARRGAV